MKWLVKPGLFVANAALRAPAKALATLALVGALLLLGQTDAATKLCASLSNMPEPLLP